MATFPSFLLLDSWQSDPVEGSNLKSSLILSSVTLSSSDFHPTSLATPSQSPSPLCYFLEVGEHQGHGSFLHRQPFPGWPHLVRGCWRPPVGWQFLIYISVLTPLQSSELKYSTISLIALIVCRADILTLIYPAQNFDFSSHISSSVFPFSKMASTPNQWLKQTHHILPRLLPSSWSLCFCSSLQNSSMAFHLKIPSNLELRLWFAHRALVSVTSSPPTSSLSPPLRPRWLHAAPRKCHAHLHVGTSAPRASSPWSPLASESSRTSFLTSMLQYHPSKQDALIILSKTSPPCHSLSPQDALLFFTITTWHVASVPICFCPLECKVEESWDLICFVHGSVSKPRRVPGTQ